MIAPKQPGATEHAPWSSGPFWVIALSPLATLPLGLLIFQTFARVEGSSIGLPEVSHGFIWDSHWGYARIPATFIALLLPGAINLTALFWLRAGERFTRIAAAAAGLLGLVRMLIPLMVLIPAVSGDIREPVARPDSDFSTDFGTIWFGGSVSADGPRDNLDMVKGNDGGTYFWYDDSPPWFGPGFPEA